MAVRAGAWRPGAVPMYRTPPRLQPLVPLVAILLATLPSWAGLSFVLPAPLGREHETLVLVQAPAVAKPMPAANPVALAPTLPIELPAQLADVRLESPPPSLAPPVRRRPTFAVAGVGLQGLVLRSEPGAGDRIRLIDEGTDLRDLGEERYDGERLWKRVEHPDGAVGWVAGDFLVPWDGHNLTARRLALLERTAGAVPSAERDRSWMNLPEELRSITPDQLKDGTTLGRWEAYSACGPAAAVAFSRAVGHDLTLDEAVTAARRVGWNPWQGMSGPRGQLALLASLGIPAHQRGVSEDTIEWERVVSDVQAGMPVVVVTINHYFVAEAYDEATGRFDFGNSARVLAAARNERWFGPDEIWRLGFGEPFTTIHLGRAPQPPDYARTATLDY